MLLAIALLAQVATATPAPPPCPPVYIVVLRDETRYVLTAPPEDLGKQVRLSISDGTTIRMDKSQLDEKESKRATANASGCPLEVHEVVQAPGRTADQLYSSALAWVPVAFKSTKGVTQLADRAAGMIVLKGKEEWSVNGWQPARGYVDYTLTIEAKDGRYRYSVGHFDCDYGPVTDSATYSGPKFGNQKSRDAIQKLARDTSASLAASLKAAMAKPAEEW